MTPEDLLLLILLFPLVRLLAIVLLVCFLMWVLE
jgi:hypothetical protein